jgi:hypothetical protein
MKKAKVMITCIAVLSIVGGALAFKAKNVSQNFVCTADPGSDLCPTAIHNVTADLTDNGGTNVAFTIVNDPAECTANEACLTSSGFITTE